MGKNCKKKLNRGNNLVNDLIEGLIFPRKIYPVSE